MLPEQNSEHIAARLRNIRLRCLTSDIKEILETSFVKRGCEVTVVPAYTTAEEIKEISPDGIMLSNGPGDPAENTEIIENIKEISDWESPYSEFVWAISLCAGSRRQNRKAEIRTQRSKSACCRQDA